MIPEKDYSSQLERIYTYLNNLVPLSWGDFQQLKEACTIREFEKKTLIIELEEVENYVNFVLNGLVRKYILVGKKEVTQQLAMEGHIIYSEISFMTRTPSRIIIEAIEPTTLLSIKHEALETLFGTMPKMERLTRLLLTDLFMLKDKRDFNYLSRTTRERFLDYVQSHPHILQRVPQKYIASYLDIKPETFSRLKHLLQKKRS